MSLFDRFKPQSAEAKALQAESAQRQADILDGIRRDKVPDGTRDRLDAARGGRMPWTATLTPSELLIARSHGLRPVAAVTATCWLHHGWSWTEGHAQGWQTALHRLRAEAVAAGANAVLDVKMRTIPLAIGESTDFTLIGTAVYLEGSPPSKEPVVATVPALEFVKLIEADVIPTGIAIGAHYDWLTDWRGSARQSWRGNTESKTLSHFWERVRHQAHAGLRRDASRQGNGVLAHLNFSQMFEFEGDDNQSTRYLGRHIVVATTVDARRAAPFRHDITMVVDVRQGGTPLTGAARHHQSYDTTDEEGAL